MSGVIRYKTITRIASDTSIVKRLFASRQLQKCYFIQHVVYSFNSINILRFSVALDFLLDLRCYNRKWFDTRIIKRGPCLQCELNKSDHYWDKGK